MPLQYQSFCVPKRDNSALEYEDASAAAPELNTFAIADGATESSFAAMWAQLLVNEFVRTPACRASEWRKWLPPLQERWEADIGTREMPWYAENKLQMGAFATFLGVVFEDANRKKGKRWRAIAVGDCCLFQIRAASMLRVFPELGPTDFNNHPGLVGSRTPPTVLLEKKRVQTRKGVWQAGDQIWLMTDALAHWFLSQEEAGKKPCDAVGRVLRAATNQHFAEWIDGLRRTRELKDDDVTLMAVSL